MRHQVKGRKFGRNTKHRKALIRNLAKSLINHETIHTTLAKAKDIRPLVEKLITKAKVNTLHTRRELLSFFQNDSKVVDKALELGKKSANRAGGYLRIVKTGYRQGDAAPMAVIQFVEEKLA
jgi:large subunit ribosomal protein L17